MIKNALRLFLIPVLLMIIFTATMGQSAKVPPFRMVQASGNIFKAEDLPLGKPIMIIYFSPECDHCHKLVKLLVTHAAVLKKISIAMITHLPVAAVSKFVKQHNLAKQANYYVGTEGSTFFVRDYYKVTEMPFTALYTRQGDLVTKYLHQPEMNDLFGRLKHL